MTHLTTLDELKQHITLLASVHVNQFTYEKIAVLEQLMGAGGHTHLILAGGRQRGITAYSRPTGAPGRSGGTVRGVDVSGWRRPPAAHSHQYTNHTRAVPTAASG